MKLSIAAINDMLDKLEGWNLEGSEIYKMFEFPSFADAILFVSQIAERAEASDHHPDIDIRYRKVKISLSTHSENGLTKKDFMLAGEIDRIKGQM
ncbi:4a-hydroxytetrahydrobiopterin dehydratase [Candidatus Woesearchaeota archaeon]|nr:4a-hydroxytetrahydrobiopterin dehydratase [Candidatus Woesearchaeota archaeon]